jgi:hypothetical protein
MQLGSTGLFLQPSGTVGGGGIAGQIALWTTPTTLGSSAIADNGAGTLSIAAAANPTPTDARTLGTNALRWSDVAARRGRLFDFAGGGTIVTTQAAGTSGLLAGSQFAAVGATSEIALTNFDPTFRPSAVFGQAVAQAAGGVARVRNVTNGFVCGNATAYGPSTGTALLENTPTAYGSFTGGYAYTASAAPVTVTSTGITSFCWGHAAASGPVGASATVRAAGAGAVCFGRAEGDVAGAKLLEAFGGGSLCTGLIRGGAVANLRASGDGAVAHGFITSGTSPANILASGAGSFAAGSCVSAAIAAAITASGLGSFAQGSAANGETIAATATNAVQFGIGTNATANSLGVGGSFRARAGGQFGGANQILTLGLNATTFLTQSNLMSITGNGANVIATITGGLNGQHLILIFSDALVTITDDNSHAANTVDLTAAFVSVDDAVLTLVFDGVSWYEVSRALN